MYTKWKHLLNNKGPSGDQNLDLSKQALYSLSPIAFKLIAPSPTKPSEFVITYAASLDQVNILDKLNRKCSMGMGCFFFLPTITLVARTKGLEELFILLKHAPFTSLERSMLHFKVLRKSSSVGITNSCLLRPPYMVMYGLLSMMLETNI